jgi:hypothetical protein
MPVITRLTLTSKKLAKLNQAHRNWVLFLGHVANEMNSLSKLLLWTDPKLNDPSNPRVIAGAAQMMIITRILLGKQFEAYKVLKNSYFDSPVQSLMEKTMNGRAVEASRRIRGEFTAPDTVHSIVRNRFAFHYSLYEVGQNFQAARKGEGLFVLLGTNRDNVLYDASEVIINRALLSHIDPNIKLATERVIDAVNNAVLWFGDFCDGFIEAVLVGAWGDPGKWKMDEALVEGPNFDDVMIPWFTEHPKAAGGPPS